MTLIPFNPQINAGLFPLMEFRIFREKSVLNPLMCDFGFSTSFFLFITVNLIFNIG